jgi:lysozyme family protein
MTNIAALTAANADRWAKCSITPSRQAEVDKVVRKLCAPDAKFRYQAISQAVWGTPDRWFFVAIVHEREAGGPPHWDKQLGQGDPLNEISRHVPRGRGPFLTHPGDVRGNDAFHRGGVDAMVNCAPYAGRWTDWTIAGVLTLFVMYNGTGYEAFHHEASPYDWGATNIEQFGKYVGDGIYSAHAWDTQLGCAAMLKGMMALDPTIIFAGVTIAPSAPNKSLPSSASPARPSQPSIRNPSKGSIGAFIASLIAAIFKRK